MILRLSLLLLTILAVSVGPVLASSGVRPPIGLQLFCLKDASACRSGGGSSVGLSEQLYTLLDRVNRNVNASIQPRNDRGVDTWQLNARYGDCEDYVLTKRQKLIEHGVPAGALRIGYTQTAAGIGHAVLIVRTDRGDLVLDNLRGNIVGVRDSGYLIERMSTANVLEWTSYN